MKRIAAYFRAFIADSSSPAGYRACSGPSDIAALARTLDHPTYLRRRLVIAGVTHDGTGGR